MARKALITGITGQDGSYLAELLLSKDYEVHGIIRRASTFNTGRLDPVYSDPHAARTRLTLHYGDLSDASALSRLIAKSNPRKSTIWRRKAMSVSLRQPRVHQRHYSARHDPPAGSDS